MNDIECIHLGDRAYSSWSMRIGLLVRRFDLDIELRFTPLYTEEFETLRCFLSPVRTVPAMVLADGSIIGETVAIAEELADRFPDRPFWPQNPAARARARSLAAEMHAGFQAVREACPMNLRAAYASTPVSDAVRADLERLETIWAWAIEKSGGPWLCGDYSIADAFYAPVAARIATYALPAGPVSRSYVDRHLSDPTFAAWRTAALVDGPDQATYFRDYPVADWPGKIG